MTRRITRAKQQIKDSRVPFRLPAPEQRAERLAVVLHVLYLIFTEGYAATSGGSLYRAELSAEAIRLTRIVHHLLPDDGEVAGLLALMLLTDALPRGRTGPYQLQAAIAALHDEAANAEATDWPQIKALYELLLQISDNPIIALNHAVAVAMADGATSGLQRLEVLATDKRLA